MEGSISIPKLNTDLKIVEGKLGHLKKAQRCAFVLGLTGSGKSSLISYLCGAELQFFKKNGKYKLSHNEN